jgi:hypothetical protein
MVVQRAREWFADRLEDVLHMVRQDRQELRGWQEPAHVRAVLRRIIREDGTPESGSAEVLVAEREVQVEFGRGAGEPDRGQQREVVGQVLEAGVVALEKLHRTNSPDLTDEETLSLECVLLLYGRPAVLVSQGRLGSVPPSWNVLEDQREDIEMAQRGVGRIELLGHPEYDWAGTGFLVNETTLLTTRRIAELFAEQVSDRWQFRPGITTWMDYRSTYQRVASAGYRVRGVIGVHPRYDLALLEVEQPQQMPGAPTPLALAARPPSQLEGRPVYLLGYPVRDARRNEPETLARIFRDVYNVKRVQPGQLHGTLRFHDVEFLRHDCAPLGQSNGSCLVDLETHQVLGLHLTGRYLDSGTAIPLWALRDDPLLKRAGVTFAEATTTDRETVASQLERLARSRYWNDARTTINQLYQRAFGSNGPEMPR